MNIHRYFLPVADEQSGELLPVSEIDIEIPAGARLLDVALTSRGLALYALVNADNEIETRSFVVATTGAELPEVEWDTAAFLGTVKVPGAQGWHVFEATKVAA